MTPHGGSAEMARTGEEEAIIAAPANAKIQLEAGPGTGETAVACGRMVRQFGEETTKVTGVKHYGN